MTDTESFIENNAEPRPIIDKTNESGTFPRGDFCPTCSKVQHWYYSSKMLNKNGKPNYCYQKWFWKCDDCEISFISKNPEYGEASKLNKLKKNAEETNKKRKFLDTMNNAPKDEERYTTKYKSLSQQMEDVFAILNCISSDVLKISNEIDEIKKISNNGAHGDNNGNICPQPASQPPVINH